MGLLLLVVGGTAALFAQTPVGLDPAIVSSFTWRPIGPFTAGRALVVAGASSRPGTLYAGMDGAGLWRTDDYGMSWQPLFDTQPAQVVERIAVDAANPDHVRAVARDPADLSGYESTDGGVTWNATTTTDPEPASRALSRADVSVPADWTINDIWIDPERPDVVVAATDTGVRVSLSGGRAWGPPGPIPTSGFSAIITDNAFPYRICGSQPGRRPQCAPSRTPAGPVRASDWQAVGLGTPGSLAADPANTRILFLSDGSTVTRLDRDTGVLQDVSPAPGAGRHSDSPPLFVRSQTPRRLLFAADRLWQSADAGQTWTTIDVPADFAGVADDEPRIAIVEPSPIDGRLLWLASGDGRVFISRDSGTTWSRADLAPAGPDVRVSSIGASHFDGSTGYVAFENRGADPMLLRTRDGGSSWTPIVAGLPDGTVHVVREDPLRRGFLWAGTDRGVFVSFDDGESWQGLGRGMPTAAVRDLAIREADVIAATADRGVFVLDDISPLRQITADVGRAPAFLFRPSIAYRSLALQPTVRQVSPAEPSSTVPDGVALTYLVGPADTAPADHPVALEVIESLTGEVIRRFDGTSAPATPGLHRVYWDLRHAPPPAARLIPDGGPSVPGTLRGVIVVPGAYQVRLTLGDAMLRQAVVVRLDPRLRVSPSDLNQQYSLARSLDSAMRQVVSAIDELEQEPSTGVTGGRVAALRQAGARLPALFAALQQADTAPTAAQEQQVAEALAEVERLLAGMPGMP